MREYRMWNWPLHGKWGAGKGFLLVNDVAMRESSNFLDYYADYHLIARRTIGIYK